MIADPRLPASCRLLNDLVAVGRRLGDEDEHMNHLRSPESLDVVDVVLAIGAMRFGLVATGVAPLEPVLPFPNKPSKKKTNKQTKKL